MLLRNLLGVFLLCALTRQARAGADVPPLPSAAGVPTWADLKAMQEELKQVPALPLSADANPENPMVVPLPDDWTTQGAWLGRYGKYWAVLFASIIHDDYQWGSGYGEGADKRPSYWIQIGPNRTPSDKVRRWLHWVKTQRQRSLEIPNPQVSFYGLSGSDDRINDRRQSEADDHGEVYPATLDGPDLYCSVQVPPGQYVLSLYNTNKDGESAENRNRDYVISVRAEPYVKGGRIGDIQTFDKWPESARARIRDFRGGVWKKFLVKGPCYLAVKVGRNSSRNTILAAAMLDKMDALPAPFSRSYAEQKAADLADRGVRVYVANESQADYLKRFEDNSTENWTAWNVYHGLDLLRNRNPVWWAQNSRRYELALARWFEVASKRVEPEKVPRYLDRLALLYYRTDQFEKWEAVLKLEKITPPREVEKSLVYNGQAVNLSGREAELISQWKNGTMQVASEEATLKNVNTK